MAKRETKEQRRARYQRNLKWYRSYYQRRKAITPRRPSIPRKPAIIKPIPWRSSKKADVPPEQYLKARQVAARRHQRIYGWINDYKSARPCTDCHKHFPPVAMDFDHLREKTMSISVMANHGFTIERIKEEIDRCELVCANCHRIRTHKRNHEEGESCRHCA